MQGLITSPHMAAVADHVLSLCVRLQQLGCSTYMAQVLSVVPRAAKLAVAVAFPALLCATGLAGVCDTAAQVV